MSDAGGSAAVVLCTDFIFATKISATARALGVEVEVIRTSGALAGRAPALFLVDLDADDALPAIASCRSAAPGARIVAFGPHVEAKLLAAAREQGADEALARSAFVRRLPEMLEADP